jgi:hypothetical protein
MSSPRRMGLSGPPPTGGPPEPVAILPLGGWKPSMDANDESPGLKIAVAAFLTLSVILAVACYFLYSAYSSANARFESTRDELIRFRSAQNGLQKKYDDLRAAASSAAAAQNGLQKKHSDDLRAKVGTETPAAGPAKKANEPATPR